MRDASWRITLMNLSLCLGLTGLGCTHMGPRTIPVDRFDYSSSIADSWKQQTLLNIVKIRYMDLPVFVDVASIVAGYSIQTGVSVNGNSSSSTAVQGDFLAAGGQAIYTDRPTITYVPMTGEKWLRGMITPIDPKNIFFMLQAGYPADFILGLTVESLNGVRNRSSAGGSVREADPDFARALELLREIQIAGALALQVEENKAKGTTGVVVFRLDDVPPDIREKGAEVRRLLRLPAEGQRFVLTFSPGRGAEGELAVNSRSMLQIMGAFASYVDAPKAHVAASRAVPGASDSPGTASQPRVRIRNSKTKPPDTFAAVRYRDYWFWVDDSDWQTKRALTAVIFFFTLTDSSGADRLPLVTIPAQ